MRTSAQEPTLAAGASPGSGRPGRSVARYPLPLLVGALAAAGLAGSAGCSGSIGDGGSDSTGASPPASASTAGASDSGVSAVAEGGAGPMNFRRLTVVEYQNTVRSLFSDPTIGVDMPADPLGDNSFSEAPTVSDGLATVLFTQAQTLATKAVQNLATLLGCDPATTGDDACEKRFIQSFARKAYRKPLETAESDALFAFYQSVRAAPMSYGLQDATRLVVTAILESPRFDYHWEREPTLTAAGAITPLTPYELASRLSYFLWSDMPDDALFAAADANALTADADVEAQVIRMMSDPRFQQTLENFHETWLGLDTIVAKDPNNYPQFTPALQQAMIAETDRFVHSVFFEGDGRFSTLMTSTVADVDAPLAAIYGVTPPAKGTATARVNLDATKYGGILTRAAMIAANTNANSNIPPRMGLTIWSSLLCNVIAPPPQGAQAQFVYDPDASTRENFATLQTEPACTSCHSVLNPLGFAFEIYDQIGEYRTMEGPHPIDASGVFIDDSQPFTSIVDLAKLMGTDPTTNKCMATNWAQYALARTEVADDKGSFAAAFASTSAPSLDIRGFIKNLALSSTFRNRAVEAGEVSP